MKKGIILLLLASSVFAKAQTLKDALFGGKLKTQPGTVIKKDDDLSTKMDTTQNAAYNTTVLPTAARSGADSATQTVPAQTTSAVPATTDVANSTVDSANTISTSAAVPVNNNTLWKTYADSVASTLKTEVLSSKKVKRGDYAVTVTYTIETDGQTTVSDVFLSPDNDYLKQQLRSRLVADSPRLAPVLNSAGAPRKVIKRYSFTLSKE